jgi:antitoxin (DNA-binding transcriptional repressor) of toxin-antitoxin stability system
MKTVGAFEAKTHLSQLLAEIEKNGEEFVILKRGKKTAILMPYDRVAGKLSGEKKRWVLEGFREVRAAYKSGPRLKAKDLINEGRKR